MDTPLREKLKSIHQQNVLRFFDQLGLDSQKKLEAQLRALDLDHIAELAETQVREKAPLPLPKSIEPVKAYPREANAEHRALYQQAE